jgi:phage/plasmid-associated DNA primase
MKQTKEELEYTISSKELIDGPKVQKILDHYDDIVPKKQKVKHMDGFKVDQSYVLRNMLGKLKDGEVITNYQYSKTAETHGRQYACRGVSLQSMTKVLRHTLCKDVYRDYDMVNSAPTIALGYLAKKNMSVHTPYLKDYVKNRDKCIKDLMSENAMSRDDVKQLILSVFNGGNEGYNALQKRTDWIVGFYDEAYRIRETIYKDPTHEDLLKEVKKLKKGKTIQEHKRSLANKLWVDIENTILEHCIKWCHSIGLSTEYIVLCFDGFMLPCTEDMPEDWAKRLSDYVFEKSGYRVQFDEKYMNEGVDLTKFEALTRYEEPTLNVDENHLIAFVENPSDQTLAQLFYSAFGKHYKYDGSTWFVFNGQRWSVMGITSLPAHVRKLTPYITRLYDYEQFKNDEKKVTKALDYIQQSRNDKSMLNKLYGFEGITDPMFPSLLDTNTNLTAFANGVLEYDTKTFREGKPEDMIFKFNDYDYEEFIDLEEESEKQDKNSNLNRVQISKQHRVRRNVANELFSKMMPPEEYRVLLSHLAEIIRGGNKEQRFNFWEGDGSNGKSLLKEALDAIMPGYTKNIAKELFTKEKKHANGGEPEIVELQGARTGIVVETDEDDKFSVSMFKRLSGGDTLTTRRLFSNVVVTFKPVFKPIVLTNHLPKFSSIVDYGTTRRIRIYKFPYKFVDNPNPNKPEEKQRLYNIDVTSRVFRNHFLHLLLNAETDLPETDSMIQEKMTYIRTLNPVSEWWEECVDLDEPEEGSKGTEHQQYYRASLDDKVSTTELLRQYNEWTKIKGLPMINPQRFGRCLAQITTIEKGDIDGKRNIKHIQGYKKYEDPEKEDEDEDDVKGKGWMGGYN